MATGDGVTWNEATPDNSTIAHQIDDFNRDLRVGIRSRMGREHVWPSSQAATNEAGLHEYISFQTQAAAPTLIAGSGQIGALWCSDNGLFFTESSGGDIVLINTAGLVTDLGTQGNIVIAHSAGGLKVLAASADGLALVGHTNTGEVTFAKLDHGVALTGTEDNDHPQYARGQADNIRLDSSSTGYTGATEVAVVFNFTFSSTPVVTLSISTNRTDLSQPIIVRTANATGFTAYCGQGGYSATVNWMAMGIPA